MQDGFDRTLLGRTREPNNEKSFFELKFFNPNESSNTTMEIAAKFLEAERLKMLGLVSLYPKGVISSPVWRTWAGGNSCSGGNWPTSGGSSCRWPSSCTTVPPGPCFSPRSAIDSSNRFVIVHFMVWVLHHAYWLLSFYWLLIIMLLIMVLLSLLMLSW